MSAARRRRAGETGVRFPRRRRGLVPVRCYAGTFTLDTDGRRPVVRLPVARGRPALWVRLARPLPYPAEQVRSVRLVNQGRRLSLDVTAELPIATYPAGAGPDPARVAGVDLGIIHRFAVLAPARDPAQEEERDEGLLVSGRAIRAEHRLHLAERKARARAVARRAPKRGQHGSRRWKHYRARSRRLEARHRRRLAQARHEAAGEVIDWAVQRRIGTLVVGDPRGLLAVDAGRRQNKAVHDWAVGADIAALRDKAQAAGIGLRLVDERGTSSTCPACGRRTPKPRGRNFVCPHPGCGFTGHRDLVGAANIASRAQPPGCAARGGPVAGPGPVTTHRRAGRHLPGAGRSRRDPRRALLSRPPGRPNNPTAPPAAGSGGGSTWPAVARPAAPAVGSRSPAPRRRGSPNARPPNRANVP